MSRRGPDRSARRRHERQLAASQRALVRCEEDIEHATRGLAKAKRTKSAAAVDTAQTMLGVLTRQREHLKQRLAELRGEGAAA